MVPTLDEINPVVSDNVHETMLLGDPPRPDAGAKEFQRLRFSYALEGVSDDGFHQGENAKGRTALGLDPMAEILSELRLKHRLSLLRFSREISASEPSP